MTQSKSRAIERLLRAYPQIFFACHVRHIPDPRAKRLLTSRQRELLDHLSDERGMSVRELAAHVGVTSSTMSITVDRLVQRGYVVRAVDEQDRRRVELRLTRLGLRVRGAQEVLDARRVARLLARLAPNELEQALRGIETLAQAARVMMSEPEPPGPAPEPRSRRTKP